MKIHSTQSPQQKSPRIFILAFVLLLLGCLGLLFFQSRGRRPPKPSSGPTRFCSPSPPPLYILQNEDGDLVGAVGCQAYDPAEGESPAAIELDAAQVSQEQAELLAQSLRVTA